MSNTFESKSWLHQPLAIVGMSCRLPGGDGLGQFWDSLVAGRSSVRPFSEDRLDRSLYYDSEKGVRGKTYSDLGGFVTERELDWELLGLNPDESSHWDPCHLNLCEVAAQAVRQAGFDREQLRDLKTGVFVGHSGGSTLGGELAYRTLARDYVDGLPHHLENAGLGDAERKGICKDLLAQIQGGRPRRENGYPRVDASYASALISRTLGLNGNSVSIDAACASSLVALALAATSLHSGESDVALVGGASFNKADSLILFSHAQSCSADGSRPFDEKANGLIGSEGYVVLVVKTLTQAEKDGDKIEAVIRGIGISSDGRGRSLWAPRKEGQYEAIERAYSSSVSPDSVQLIEAHATSTQVGDATEMEALSAFYSQHIRKGQKLPVGSVKSNIGHTLETAGLAGLLKSILAIQNKTVPPSIGIENLSSSIPWSDIPLYVPTAREAWNAAEGTPRRAAVNAFGIGGLNVHVVVDEYVAQRIHNSGRQASAGQSDVGQRSAAVESGRVAVIGRGLVLPGSRDLSEYLQAADSHRSTESLARVENFEYDWRKHKVPPKQIAHANPLQFMLLDAAQQAFQDAGMTEDSYDRSRAAVVVGSPFGGDFGNSLFAGLRLPEFRNQLQQLLESRGISDSKIGDIVSAYEKQFLEKHPALLDETGSFTSSTLASRLSKTFNLMGGAMALDSGDCSGLAAISSAIQLLNSGAVDLVLCAAAHSALDSAAVENLEQLGRFKQDGSRPVVGEGVVLLLLQREQTAKREGRAVHSLLHSASVSFDSHSNRLGIESVIRDAVSTVNHKPEVATGSIGILDVDVSTRQALAATSIECRQSRLFPTTGYLQAVQPLAEIVEQTRVSHGFSRTLRESQKTFSSQLVLSHTSNGLCHAVQSTNSRPQPTSSLAKPSTVEDAVNTAVFKFEASSLQELKKFLQSDDPRKHATRKFQSPDAFRCVIACGREDLERRSRMIGNQLTASTPPSQFVSQCVYWSSPEHREGNARVAWMFPGQGSQYLGMLQTLLAQDPMARADLDLANELIQAKCGVTFEQIAWDSSSQLGDDYWQTQISILASNWLLSQYLRRVGTRPDAVVGHSFGEFSAILEAGCWSLEQAIEATWQRCQALDSYAPDGMMMLGVQADSETVSSTLSDFQDQVFISHRNAPQQTVIGGRRAAVIDASQKLDEIGVAARLLAVPTAFHTPALAQVGKPFFNALEKIPMLPAQGPVLSGVNNRYVSDPTEFRRLLAEQLTQPIDFVAMIRRLVNDGINAFVEVGPQQVLTKLVKQILPDARVFSCDHPKLGAHAQLQFTVAQLECMGVLGNQADQSSAKRVSSPVHFDATKTRRIRLRNTNSGGSQSDARRSVRGTQAAHFDATVERREKNIARREHVLPAPSLPMETSAASATDLAKDSSSTTDSGKVSPRESLTQLLVDFVVEQTGYPEEIIELDWDIEADLGIDSIKKAQLFGELREFFEFEQVADFSLEKFKTLNEIVNLLEQVPAKRELPAVGVSSKTNANSLLNEDSQVASRVTRPQAVAEPEPQKHQSRLPGSWPTRNSEEEYTRVLVDFVVEQTGYPREIVELDADLEADLGIDSIKQAQLIGELREIFGADLKSAAVKHASQNDRGFATLRAILEFLLEHQRESVISTTDRNPVCVGNDNSTGTDAATVASEIENNHSKIESLQPEGMAFTSQAAECLAASQATYSRLVSKPSDDQVRQAIEAVDSASRVELQPFSSRFGVQPAIVRNLEHELINQCYWKPITSRGQPSTGKSQSNGNTTNWFAELKGPEWLIRNRDEGLLELEQKQGEASLVKIAGSRLVHASVLEGRYAVIACSLSENIEERARFQRRFESLHESELPTFQSLLTIAKRNASENDSFYRIFNTSSGEATTVLGQNGDVEMEDETAIQKYRDSIEARSLNGASLAKIGFDVSSRNIVLRTENDYGAHRLTIPCVNRDQTSEKDHTSLPQLNPNKQHPHGVSNGEVASRYVLRMAPAPLRQPKTRNLEWCGAAVIVGNNPIARQLEARLRLNGVQTYCLDTNGSDDARSLQRQFEELAATTRVPYLFLTTPWDADAQTRLDAAAWNQRRNNGVFENFWLCQSWLGHVVEAGISQDSQLVAMTVMGGDFGFGGNLYSTEGGALGGLLKSMLIETWTQGIRPLPIKVLDSDISDSPAHVVENLWQELNCPSYDFEVSYRNQIRHVVRAIPKPLATNSKSLKQPTGTFVCTGGARGITAYVAEQLALRYDLNLQLIGKSPAPQVHDSWKHLEGDDLRQLKTQIMTTARKNGQNPVVAWQDTEKAIEIDATLLRLHELGIEAQYHQCDVGDAEQVEAVLATIRRQVGPIKGILHGAGVGRDARFDRKQPEKVEQCIAAKIDGSIALMSATKNDPLEYFVGFGSISGRFGANGHTDYSLANEMLCKQIDWFAKQRPEVKAVGFHWHAWGDVGMATKPETRLALEMINMQFMPAAEGIEHLVQELESDSDETEVLITDDRYYRMFFPSETLVNESSQLSNSQMRSSAFWERATSALFNGDVAYTGELHPVKDPFLAEHQLNGNPLLPFVIAAEMMLESATLAGNTELQIREFSAEQGLRFFGEEPKQIRSELKQLPEGLECGLFCDFKTRTGKLVEANRKHFSGLVASQKQPISTTKLQVPFDQSWSKPNYPLENAEFFVGWPFQRLRKFAILEGGLVGKISAPALIELAGSERDLMAWLSPSAAFDSCLFATGILAWQRVAPGSALPASIGLLTFERLPSPGEALEVHVQLNSAESGRASLDFSLYGVDGSLILNAQDYQVAWLSNSS